jgi:WXG100 family type VII secretion target
MTPQGSGGYPTPGGATNGAVGAGFDDLASASDHAHGTADQIHGQITRLMTTLDAMSPQWDGAARRAFYARWDELRPAIDSLRDSLYAVGDKLAGAHKSFSEMEIDNASGFMNAMQI